MSGDELRVTAAHLSELAARQATAAEETRSATVAHVDNALSASHGTIAVATSRALQQVLAARQEAGTNLADVSDALRDKLSRSVKRYDQDDEAAGQSLAGELRPGS